MARGRGWYVVGKSVQVIEDREREWQRRWMVALFFSGRRFDRRYPVRFFPCLDAALSYAFKIAVHHSGGKVEPWGSDYIAGDDGRNRIPILIVPCVPQ
jgi:hypothetical protein